MTGEKVKPKKAMNPNSLKNLKPAKPGEVRNPTGYSKEIAQKRVITRQLLVDIVNVALTGDVSELQEIAETPGTPAIQVGLCIAMINYINKGDWEKILMVSEQVLGKGLLGDQSPGGSSAPVTINLTMPANGREAPKE